MCILKLNAAIQNSESNHHAGKSLLQEWPQCWLDLITIIPWAHVSYSSYQQGISSYLFQKSSDADVYILSLYRRFRQRSNNIVHPYLKWFFLIGMYPYFAWWVNTLLYWYQYWYRPDTVPDSAHLKCSLIHKNYFNYIKKYLILKYKKNAIRYCNKLRAR